jgi:D-3-phosphoglycerate dehydrogenase / 2-oxoglutarate reductase
MVDAHAIVVADDIVDPEAVASELPASWARAVRAEPALPTGGGIVALLAGPGADVAGNAMDRLPDLRVIVVTSMGWDHVDTEAARARGVTVVGVEPYCVDEVAEHTIALVLDLMRGLTWLDASVRTGRWDYASIGRPVRGAALGLIGLGRIGAAVAWRANGLGMAVSAFDPLLGSGDGPAAGSGEGPAAGSEAGAPNVRMVHSLQALVSESDVVSVHVPLSPETKGLVDDELLARFRQGSYFVNVSRGEVVTEGALGEALRSGKLAGAALDVLAHEPPTPNDPVLDLPRTVLTPHAAWYSPAAIDRLSRSAGQVLAGALGNLPTVTDPPSREVAQ